MPKQIIYLHFNYYSLLCLLLFFLLSDRSSRFQYNNFRQGWNFITYTAEPVLLLPWLMEKFIALGGKVEKRKIRTLDELAEEGYDLIINCSGLGARELVADKTMTPIRGQVYRVIQFSNLYHNINFYNQIQLLKL